MPVNITILTELCVGVAASSMPALAKFFQHHFPDFSMIDTFLSFKSEVIKARHGKTKAIPLGSGSQDHIVQNPSLSESDQIYKKHCAHLDMNSMELGNVSHVTACDDGDVADAMNDTDGIRIGRAWERTSRKRGEALGSEDIVR
ncbi:MAG: hypothetical protein Q9225_001921 [Loekoesia sp. 1 TL-2023]